MRILDKYLLKHVLTGYLFVFTVFVSLFLIADTFSNLGDILESKPPLDVLLSYYIHMLPWIFKWVSPFAILISVLYALGEANKNNEIIGIRAAGLSIARISAPIIFFTILLSFFSLYIQERVLLSSQKKVEDIKIQYIKKKSSSLSQESDFAFMAGDKIFFVRTFYPATNTLEDVTIFVEDDQGNISKKMICQNITYESGSWIAKAIIEYNFDAKGDIAGEPVHIARQDIGLDQNPKELLYKKSIFAQFASMGSLKKEIRRLRKIKAYDKLAALIIDYNQKLADPFTHFFLIIGILPVALEIKKRKVGLTALGVGFIFSFLYYCLAAFSIALGKNGMILPYLAAWVAPLFFLAVGITGISLVK